MKVTFDNLQKVYLNKRISNKDTFIKYKDLLIEQCRGFVRQFN